MSFSGFDQILGANEGLEIADRPCEGSEMVAASSRIIEGEK